MANHYGQSLRPGYPVQTDELSLITPPARYASSRPISNPVPVLSAQSVSSSVHSKHSHASAEGTDGCTGSGPAASLTASLAGDPHADAICPRKLTLSESYVLRKETKKRWSTQKRKEAKRIMERRQPELEGQLTLTQIYGGELERNSGYDDENMDVLTSVYSIGKRN